VHIGHLYPTQYYMEYNGITFVLVIDDERAACALNAHICPALVQSILEDIHCRSFDHMLWLSVPVTNNSCAEECLLNSCRAPWREHFQTMSMQVI